MIKFEKGKYYFGINAGEDGVLRQRAYRLYKCVRVSDKTISLVFVGWFSSKNNDDELYYEKPTMPNTFGNKSVTKIHPNEEENCYDNGSGILAKNNLAELIKIEPRALPAMREWLSR